jgi:tRNA 2-selenouridine synthase
VIRTTGDLSPAARDAFDAILDVRSPAEFAADHVPGAINLPVLYDAERAEVGTLYVQTSRFLARRVGAAKVARNIADHLEGALSDRPPGFRPLIYCWRGGMRSNAMATVLAQVGWQVTLLEGGYRTWRRRVVGRLHDAPALEPPPAIRLLDGPTGSGKTALLGALAARGAQVLDLEALAGHRGSLFGATVQGQPGQKLFESRLLDALDRLDPGRPLFAEAESSRIGALSVPAALWAAMRAAPRIVLDASVEARVRHILAHYGWIGADRAALAEAIRRLPSHHSKALRESWLALAAAGDLPPLVQGLLASHYDPAYARSAGMREGVTIGSVCLGADGGLDAAAAGVEALAHGANRA